MKYSDHYLELGVSPGDDWTTIRTAYRRQIREWHPDRFLDPKGRHDAEERTKTLNGAYAALESYYVNYGETPPVDDSSGRADASTGLHAGGTDYSTEFEPWTPHTEPSVQTGARYKRRLAIVGLFAAGILYWWYADMSQQPPYIDGTTSLDGKAVTDTSAHKDSPSHYYSDSQTSKVDAPPAEAVYSPPLLGEMKLIRVGSNAGEVLALQGPPLRRSDSMWDYGPSRIFFRDGIVTGWEEHPLYPLRVKKK